MVEYERIMTCPFFWHTTCSKGDNCEFVHERTNILPKDVACDFHLRGMCKYRNMCWFKHGDTPKKKKNSNVSKSKHKNRFSFYKECKRRLEFQPPPTLANYIEVMKHVNSEILKENLSIYLDLRSLATDTISSDLQSSFLQFVSTSDLDNSSPQPISSYVNSFQKPAISDRQNSSPQTVSSNLHNSSPLSVSSYLNSFQKPASGHIQSLSPQPVSSDLHNSSPQTLFSDIKNTFPKSYLSGLQKSSSQSDSSDLISFQKPVSSDLQNLSPQPFSGDLHNSSPLSVSSVIKSLQKPVSIKLQSLSQQPVFSDLHMTSPQLVSSDNQKLTADPVTSIGKLPMYMCNYYHDGKCNLGMFCPCLHGIKCDECQSYCLHPTNLEECSIHFEECEIVKKGKYLIDLLYRQDQTCGVCYDVVSNPFTSRRFGILENCEHTYCFHCITKWSKSSNRATAKKCPQCRKTYNFITPSDFWHKCGPEKDQLIASHKIRLKKVHCKFYQRGAGICKFGENCLYLHDKMSTSTSPETQLRQHTDEDGIWSSYERNDFVNTRNTWDTLQERQVENHDGSDVGDTWDSLHERQEQSHDDYDVGETRDAQVQNHDDFDVGESGDFSQEEQVQNHDHFDVGET